MPPAVDPEAGRGAPAKTSARGGLGSAQSLGMFLVYFLSPVVLFAAGTLDFTFLYHRHPTYASVLMLGIYLGALVPFFHRRHGMLSVACIAAAVAGHATGMHNYHGPVHLGYALDDYKVYTNVLPTDPAAAHQDAIALKFSDETKVDATKSMGLKTSESTFGHTFCVAPILDAQQGERIEYWAAGVECCAHTGVFSCDDASDPDAHQGIVVRDTEESGIFNYFMGALFMPSLGNRELFLEAVKMAEAAYDMKSADRPIIVRWIKDSLPALQTLYTQESLAMLVSQLLGAAAVSLIFAASFVFYTGGRYDDDGAGLPLLGGGVPIKEVHRIAADVNKDEITRNEAFSLCCLVPFFAVVAPAMLIWTFAYGHIFGPVLCYFHTGLVLVFAVVLTFRLRLGSFGLFTILMLVTGVYMGRMNFYLNTFHYHSSADRRTYLDVLADEPASFHQDAGKVTFAKEDTILDASKAISYRFQGTDYCVAPVMPTTRLVTQVQYWAAGTNCCAKSRGDFTCGSTGSSGAKSGNRIQDFGPTWLAPTSPLPIFRTAATAAAELAGLENAQDAIFFHWTLDPTSSQEDFFGRGVGISIIALMSMGVLLGALTGLTIWMWVPKPRRRIEVPRQ